jgi:hypothetical protein
MLLKLTSSTALASVLAIGLTIMPAFQASAQEKAATPSAPQAKPTVAKICGNCHTPEQGSLRGIFDSVAYKTQSIQIKIDDTTEILKFDKATLKVTNVKGENTEEPLRDIKKGKEVRVAYTEKDGKKFATLVVAKPPVRVAPEKIVNTEYVEKLVAMGPEKGKYTLIDARPPVKFVEGSIPSAINIPFVAFDKMVDKLPKEKDALIVYFCQGVT